MNASQIKRIRTLIIASVIWLPGALFAQGVTAPLPLDPMTKLITYQEVIQVPGLRIELFNRAIEWISRNYKNAADVTKVRNPESGLIEIVHRFDLSRIDDKGYKIAVGIVNYSLRLELKDGRYRYTLTDMSLKQASRYPVERWLDKKDKAYNPNYDMYLAQLDKQVKVVIASLKTGMQQGIQKKEDIW